MAVEKVIHFKDRLKCNHGGKVNLKPTLERKTEIKSDLRVVTDKDLLQRVTISGCSLGCTKITSIPKGLAKDVELKAGAIPVLANIEAVTNKGCIVTYDGDGYSIADAVATLNANAHATSQHYCARYVQDAIRGGGIDIPGANANDFGPVLASNGFESVSSAGYTPQTGDVVQFDAVPGHPYGHTAMWNGTQWVSDFRQNGLFVADAYRRGTYTYYRPKTGAGKASGNQAHAEPL